MTQKRMRELPRMRELGPHGFTEWMEPDTKGVFYIACCDCGLAHRLEMRVVNDSKPRIEFRARQAPRYTARQRKNLPQRRSAPTRSD